MRARRLGIPLPRGRPQREEGTGLNELTLFPNTGDPVKLTPPQDDPYGAECAYFLECVAAGHPAARGTPAEARLALRVALAARESLERGGGAGRALPIGTSPGQEAATTKDGSASFTNRRRD